MFTAMLQAQDTEQATVIKSSSNTDILPAAGDIALGADALPYLNYLGNMFNSTSNNTLALGKQNLYFRYYLSESTAIRLILGVNSTTNINNYYVQDDAAIFADPLSQAKLIDKEKIYTNGINVNVGFMKTRGYARLRGFYGVQVGYGFNRTSYDYQYGNNFTIANSNPSTANTSQFVGGRLAKRLLEKDNGLVQNINAGLFMGVEYYFLPKICIGGEVAFNFLYQWGSQSNSKYEQVIGSQIVQTDEVAAPGNKTIFLGTWRPATYGGLYLMFHF
jgi:hypothetical protein